MPNTKSDLARANARLTALIDIGLELASERDMELLLHKVCDATLGLFHATYVTLGIVDLENRTVRRVVNCGAFEEAWIAPGDSVAGVLESVVGGRKTIRGLNTDERRETPAFPPSHPPVQSFLAAPIASPLNVYGWICFVGNDGRPFTAEDEHLVTALAGQVGRIYENGHFRALAEARLADLIDERDRAQRYLDTAEVMLLAIDVHGRVTLANRFACDVLGWPAPLLIGRDWIETCLPEHIRPEWRDGKFGELLAGEIATGENAVLTRSGEERQIEWRNTVQHDESGRVLGVLSSGADVTERRALEAQFHHAQKMEAIGQLAGGIAHDFNNLLTVILGFSNLVLADLAKDDSRRADIQEIHQAGQRAAALTRQLLTFSRKQVIEPALIDVNVLVDGMHEMLGRLIGDDVEVVLLHGGSPHWVLADHGQMEQIVMNLAVNARDAMAGGGTLTIKIAHETLVADCAARGGRIERGPYVKLTFSDTGTGIAQGVMAHLFEPFFTTKGPGKGTGLGLATVHGIACRSGGGIDVSTVIGEGTTFTLYLPQAMPGPAAAISKPRACATRTCTQLVLVVDDDPGVRDLARRLLERAGYRVLTAANATDARAVFSANPSVDLLLTDVIMPGDSGPELVQSLKRLRPDLKVLFMSGYAEDAIARHGVLDPGIAFIHKPFSNEMLNLKIGECLDRVRA